MTYNCTFTVLMQTLNILSLISLVQILITREDNVSILIRPDGSYLSEHPDGTRFTSLPAKDDNPPKVVTECPGFARVTSIPCQRKCTLDFWDGSQIFCSADGCYHVTKQDSFSLEISSSGETLYHRLNVDGSQPMSSFRLNHTTPDSLVEASDRVGNIFSVSRDNLPTAKLASVETIGHHSAFSPRYFVLPSDSTPFELLDAECARNIIAGVRTDPVSVVLEEDIPMPGCTSTTILQPLNSADSSSAHVVPFLECSIIPKNLKIVPFTANGTLSSSDTKVKEGPLYKSGRRRFGASVGRGLSIGRHEKPAPSTSASAVPEAIEYRQFLHFSALQEEEVREQICGGLAAYIAWRENQMRIADSLLPIDVRSVEEQEAAQQLEVQWNQGSDLTVSDTATLHMKYTTEASKLQGTKNVPPPREPEKLAAFLSAAKEELKEAEKTKEALRNHEVPMYFESSEAEEYFRSKSPDMDAHAADLAQAKMGVERLSECSTPLTLQSASVTIVTSEDGMDMAESPDLRLVSSLSKIRPSHPTPDHAQRSCTPTDVRPPNPTPLHAQETSSARLDGGVKVAPIRQTTLNLEVGKVAISSSSSSSQQAERAAGFDTDDTIPSSAIAADVGRAEKELSVSFNLPPSSKEMTSTPQNMSTHEMEVFDALQADSDICSLNRSTYVDVTGKPRSVPIHPPQSILGGRPGEVPNVQVSSAPFLFRYQLQLRVILSNSICVHTFLVHL